MKINTTLFFLVLIVLASCSDNEVISEPENLQEYIKVNENKTLDEVIACAASKNGENEVSYVFYYPIIGATNIQYFETQSDTDAKDDFELYIPLELEKEPVFNGYLERFVRAGDTENWCIVTYETEGKLHVSNPIKLKNITKPTEWSSTVTINTDDSLMPEFIWEDGEIAENAIYFEVISNSENDFLTGTYTYEKWFQFYNLENVVLNITTENTPALNINNEYNFTMMGVSEDNWVNLVIQKSFIAN